MKKVLIVITTGMEVYGGLATVMLNYYRAMDKSDLKIDFASINVLDAELKEELKKNDSKYYNLGNRKKSILKYIRSLRYIINKNKYDVIHVNGNSATMLIELQIAKLCGVKKRIAHCHTTKSDYPIINKILKPLFKKIYTDTIAVSVKSGEWLFEKNYTVLNNAIDLKHYSFNADLRSETREKLGINDEFVIGNVGKLNSGKNQSFLLEIFSEILKINNNVRLLIVGGGELEEKLKKYAKELGVFEKTIFTGMIDDTSATLQAMDFFAFTSVFEGLGMSLIEAQASGLSCVSSDVVPVETKVTDFVEYISLSRTPLEWAKVIIEKNKNEDRFQKSKKAFDSITKAGYNIDFEANKLKKIYIEE